MAIQVPAWSGDADGLYVSADNSNNEDDEIDLLVLLDLQLVPIPGFVVGCRG